MKIDEANKGLEAKLDKIDRKISRLFFAVKVWIMAILVLFSVNIFIWFSI